MSASPAIERRPLLAALLADWRAAKVDVRAIRFGPGQATGFDNAPDEHPLEFVSIDDQPLIEME